MFSGWFWLLRPLEHSRPQSLRSFWPAAGIESSGSNHFEITKEITEFRPSSLTQPSSMAQARNGCSQSSRFLPQARKIVGSGDENVKSQEKCLLRGGVRWFELIVLIRPWSCQYDHTEVIQWRLYRGVLSINLHYVVVTKVLVIEEVDCWVAMPASAHPWVQNNLEGYPLCVHFRVAVNS